MWNGFLILLSRSAMCSSADQGAECNADGSSSSSSTLLRTVVISIQAGCMLVALFLTFVVFRYRKYKVFFHICSSRLEKNSIDLYTVDVRFQNENNILNNKTCLKLIFSSPP